MPNFELEGHEIAYTVRRSKRALRARLVASPTEGLVVVLPARQATSNALKLLKEHRQWIARHLPLLLEAGKDRLFEGAKLLLRGEPHILRLQTGEGRPSVHVRPGELVVKTPAGTPEEARKALSGWLKAEARKALLSALASLRQRHEFSYNWLFLRDTKSRWGTCSSLGNLGFNWRLVMAPPEVLAYVVAHEVAHLTKSGHQRDFWALVEQLHPAPAKARAWLKANGARLRF